ncbi:unnamed protein product [Eruca vesicaria subsp. sativa]|uniref:No apical meristem-associated C-terminal domain-containing protein n=1 Tax=Eruca vesicaria subsp. sativa TaxID=29727 RepID=A0ABC8JS35_ERUVS|nr:unnamed protein product [Eruca vesicaria subsp. sativa]
MEKAKKLLLQDPKLKKGFKFDHVWVMMKDVPKFTSNVNISIPDTLNTESNTFGSPTSQSPKMPSFSINLSSDDGGSSSRPIGSKKAKLKRKTTEGNNMVADTLISSNEQILDFLKESATSRDKNHEMIELRMKNEARKLALKEVKEENKILLKNLASIGDINTREYIRSEQERIIRKRRQEQQEQPSSVTKNLFGFEDFGAFGGDLPNY